MKAYILATANVYILTQIMGAITAFAGENILYYSSSDPEIIAIINNAVPKIQANKEVERTLQKLTTGNWLGLNYALYPKSWANPRIHWRSVKFSRDGAVEIEYELLGKNEIRNFSGTYDLYLTEKGGTVNILIRSPDIEEKIMVIKSVKIRQANMLVRYGLWFKCPDGYTYIFQPTAGEMAAFLAKRMRDELDEDRRIQAKLDEAAEQRKMAQQRIPDPELTKAIIERFESGEFDEEPIPPDLKLPERKAVRDKQMKLIGEKNKAILNLMNYGDETCVPILIDTAGNAKNSDVIRQNAVRALGKIKDARAVPALLEILRKPVVGDVENEGDGDGHVLI